MQTSLRHALAALLVAALSWVSPAGADDDSDHVARIGRIAIEHAWARATRDKDGQVFLTIQNEGAADRLISASTPVADRAEIHGAVLVAGKPGSKALGPLQLAAGKTFELEPQGVFLKLVGLKRRLVKGEALELALTFETSGTGLVHVEIEAADAKRHGHAGHKH